MIVKLLTFNCTILNIDYFYKYLTPVNLSILYHIIDHIYDESAFIYVWNLRISI